MSYENVARRYARAIFEIGKESGSLAAIGQDIESFTQAYAASAELQAVLSNPLVLPPLREGIIKEIGERLGLSPTAVNVLRLLARRSRMQALPDISAQLARLIDEDASILRAAVTSAEPLSAAYLERLQGELEKATGKKVKITHAEDAALIAGVVTRIEDRVIDGSARARLARLRESLLQR